MWDFSSFSQEMASAIRGGMEVGGGCPSYAEGGLLVLIWLCSGTVVLLPVCHADVSQ